MVFCVQRNIVWCNAMAVLVIEIMQVCAGWSGGGYATKVVFHEDLCLPIPRGITTSDAASLPEVACNIILSIFTYPGMAYNTPRKEPLRVLVSKSKPKFLHFSDQYGISLSNAI